jgi:hypothetical protein
MQRKTFVIQAVLLLFVFSTFLLPSAGNAEVNVGISVGLPPLVISAPPVLVVIPGSYVYYPPEVGADMFFYHGYWYRPYQRQWFRAVEYNGPWLGIAIGRVPRPVVGISPGFRRGPVVHERVPYRDVRTHWRTWERDRYWDRGRHERREDRRDDRREHEGRGHDYGRGMR